MLEDLTGIQEVEEIEEVKLPEGKYSEYRCEWQELGLFGNVNAFGLNIRYYYANNETWVKIDEGVESTWQAAVIETKYGMVDRYDFFVGSQITVFARHLTICSCPFEVCREIEKLGKVLTEKQLWLRSKIESVRGVPVVPAKNPNKDSMTLRHTSTGKCNLRQLIRENNRLVEQLYALGMGHLCNSPGRAT
jgi:hypothetical protein